MINLILLDVIPTDKFFKIYQLEKTHPLEAVKYVSRSSIIFHGLLFPKTNFLIDWLYICIYLKSSLLHIFIDARMRTFMIRCTSEYHMPVCSNNALVGGKLEPNL